MYKKIIKIKNSGTVDPSNSSTKSHIISMMSGHTSEASHIQKNIPVVQCNAQCDNTNGPYQPTDE